MGTELHTDGPVVFTALPAGRESVSLGRVQVGEIGPVHDPRSLYPICFQLYLPLIATIGRWHPARDRDEAHRKIRSLINDWLNAADLRPNAETADAED
jgi:hypothetical protein